MATAFKPLLPGSSPAGGHLHGKSGAVRDPKVDFRPLGVSGDHLPPAAAASLGAHASNLMPGLQLTPIHAVPQVSPPSAPPMAGPKGSVAITRLIRDGERITHIEVQCACGELITLACGYAGDEAATGQPRA
jgi:hypothetical protein